MTELASHGQLRAAFLRWALVLAPGILLLGFLSGAIADSGPDNRWFEALVKPGLYPPPIAFPVVWSVLYVLMGVALAMIVSAWGAGGRGVAIGVFIAQLLLNLAWSPLFFAGHHILAALVLLVVLDMAVALTLVLFARIRPLAGALLVPYLAWALFATVVNAQFWSLNLTADGATDGVVRTKIAP